MTLGGFVSPELPTLDHDRVPHGDGEVLALDATPRAMRDWPERGGVMALASALE